MDRIPQPSLAYASTPPSAMPPTASQPPPPTSTMEGGRMYSLDVVQQPVRARMCGFGDKDRRPITPPPCVRLVVKDAKTHEELDVNEINMDFFVLTVDLWSADGSREVNLVRHSATSPSISTAVSSSYPPPPQTPPAYSYPQSQSQYQTSYNHPLPIAYPAPQGQPQQQGYYPQQQQQQQAGPPPLHQHAAGPLAPASYYQAPGAPPPTPQQASSPSGMFTRNLIGSLSASAFRLTDPENKLGVWFILQDLSVRTEGTFRLKMNFVNVGDSTAGHGLNTGSAPVLASCFSDVFQVFSAKKFPGVIESTSLSKCFATQGIKIPIRKDGPKALSNREEYDNDE
ncbi:MAG: hypothetical protein M1832_000411 [Thelocarpon impressellum]|nr:MAG: hypothetical protein M1832_000411 [Thelocarpon impressellum]